MIIPEGFENYRRIKVVNSFAELMTHPFGGQDEINALVLQRKGLAGDFRAAAKIIDDAETEERNPYFISSSGAKLDKLAASLPPGVERTAIEHMRADISRFEEHFGYTAATILQPAQNASGQFKAHADPRARDGGDERALALYDARGTLLYRNEDTRRDPDKERLYTPLPGARPFVLELGDVLRFACAGYDGAPPLVHTGPSHDTIRPTVMACGLRRQLKP